MNAYEELLVPGSYPFYMLFISIDPAHIDINVHPTKTEIKFEDEKTIYAIIRSAVKRSLGRYNIAPTLDFEADQNLVEFQQNPTDIKLPVIRVNRSEEHTSELQSLMRISYAVFCLKKKQKINNNT